MFRGEASLAFDDAARTCTIEGRGIDGRGASRALASGVVKVTPLETREEAARRALVGWPAPSRLAWRRRVELLAKASALRLSPLALFEALERGLSPLMGIDFGQAKPAFLSIAGDADRERLGLGRKPAFGREGSIHR